MSQTSRVRAVYTIVLVLWALFLLLEGRNVGEASTTRDAAKATYQIGAALLAAIAILPWTLNNRR